FFPEIGKLEIGIGVSSGPLVAGNVGGRRQMEYTVIGDTVNLSARLTGRAGAGEVWASAATVVGLPEGIFREELPPVQVKGKLHEVIPYRLWPVSRTIAS